jgi:predicted nucleic acid-binding protein
MVVNALIDTGAIVALLNDKDKWHPACAKEFQQIRLPALTSEAVLTELFHFVFKSPWRFEKAWAFLTSGAISVVPITHDELPEIRALMLRYLDRPMDFADATLVYLAQRESISTVFTIDHADFATYRIGVRGRFRVLPAKSV